MNDAGVPGRRETPSFGGDGACAAADEDHEVGGFDDRARRRRAAVAADDADRQPMPVADASMAADGGRHRRIQPFGDA